MCDCCSVKDFPKLLQNLRGNPRTLKLALKTCLVFVQQKMKGLVVFVFVIAYVYVASSCNVEGVDLPDQYQMSVGDPIYNATYTWSFCSAVACKGYTRDVAVCQNTFGGNGFFSCGRASSRNMTWPSPSELMIQFTGGTVCGIVNEPRSTTFFITCDPHVFGFIVDKVSEATPCSYTIIGRSSSTCNNGQRKN